MMSSWLLFKSGLNCRWCDDPVICSLAPRSAACPDGSHHSWRGGQGAKFMWHWIHSGVRCFNRTLMESCPKPLKTLNVRFLCSRQNGSAVSLRVSQPQPLCDTILFANPLADAFSILFHMYCMQRKLEPPPLLLLNHKQNKTFPVKLAHSWASSTTWSTVWSLCFLWFTLSLTEEEGTEWTSQSSTRARSTRMLVLSPLSLSVCGQTPEPLIEGSVSSPCPGLAGHLRPSVPWSNLTPPDCDWQKWKPCTFPHQLLNVPFLGLWPDLAHWMAFSNNGPDFSA